MTNITWKAIPDYEGLYEVSDTGLIKSLERKDTKGRHVSERILKPGISPLNYQLVVLRKDNRSRTFWVHSLVMLAFAGPRPEDRNQIAHGDNDPSNNCFSNLRYATRAENEADKDLHGTRPKGDQHWTKRYNRQPFGRDSLSPTLD